MSDTWQASIVLIKSSKGDEDAFGTGFVIYQGEQVTYVVTCAHVVRAVGEHNVRVADVNVVSGTGGPDKITDFSATLAVPTLGGIDIAVLCVEGLLDKPPLRLHHTIIEKGKSFRTAGFRRADKDSWEFASLEGIFGKQTKWGQTQFVDNWYLEINEDDDQLSSGNSGSPVIDESDYVVAVVTTERGAGKRGTAISIDALEKVWPEIAPRLFERATVRPIENKILGSQSRSVGENVPGKTLPQPIPHRQTGEAESTIIQNDHSLSEGVVGSTQDKALLQSVQHQIDRPSSEGIVGSTQKQKPSTIYKVQMAVGYPFFIVGVCGFIYFIVDIVQAFQGHSPAWWAWISGIIVWIGGLGAGSSLMDMPQEQFLKSLVVIVYTLCAILGLGGLIDLIIDIVLATHGHSPTWWIWTIAISGMLLGLMLINLPDEMQKWEEN